MGFHLKYLQHFLQYFSYPLITYLNCLVFRFYLTCCGATMLSLSKAFVTNI